MTEYTDEQRDLLRAEPGPMVEVWWTDSGGQGGWHDPMQSAIGLDRTMCRNVGFLVEDSDRGVCIVMGYGATGMHCDSMTVPRVNVVKVTRLRR